MDSYPISYSTIALAVGVAVLTAALLGLLVPDHALAALKSAAGGGGQGAGGFNQLVRYMDRLAGYLLVLAVPAATLGLIAAGGMMLTGNPRATSIATGVAVGFIIILASKGLAA